MPDGNLYLSCNGVNSGGDCGLICFFIFLSTPTSFSRYNTPRNFRFFHARFLWGRGGGGGGCYMIHDRGIGAQWDGSGSLRAGSPPACNPSGGGSCPEPPSPRIRGRSGTGQGVSGQGRRLPVTRAGEGLACNRLAREIIGGGFTGGLHGVTVPGPPPDLAL